MLKLTKSSVYMIMGGISIFLAMISHYQSSSFFYILPQFSSPAMTLLNVMVNIAIALLLVVKAEHKLIVMTSHNKEDIQLLCDRTFTISDGKVMLEDR